MRDIPVKHPGDQFFADECTDMFLEEENLIQDTGIVLTTGDLFQISKAVSNYVASGDYYNDGGALNTYVLSPLSLKKAPTFYAEGMRVRFYPANANDGPSIINVNSLGIKAIKKFDGSPLNGNEIIVNTEIILAYDGTNFRITSSSHADLALSAIPKFRGCILTNNLTDPNKDLNFNFGYFRADNADIIFHNPSSLVKRIDAAWAIGTGAGGRAGGALAEGWWHNFYIAKPDGTVDAGWDTNQTALNLLAAASGYHYYARRTSTYITSGININQFYNVGDEFWWDGIPFTVTTISASYLPVTIATPPHVTTKAKLNVGAGFVGGNSGAIFHKSLLAPNTEQTVLTFGSQDEGAENNTEILADVDGQIEHKYTGNTPTSYGLRTLGYKEFYN